MEIKQNELLSRRLVGNGKYKRHSGGDIHDESLQEKRRLSFTYQLQFTRTSFGSNLKITINIFAKTKKNSSICR